MRDTGLPGSMRIRRLARVQIAAGLLLLVANRLAAQTTSDSVLKKSGSVTLIVAVVDSANQPIADADVAVIRSVTQVLASARSDSRGLTTLRVQRSGSEIQITTRRIGFRPSARFLHADQDSIRLLMRLDRAAQRLSTVAVTAQEDVKRRSYYVDADEIAASRRLIMNGMDVLTKMKPDILQGRAPGCGVQNIFVNGVRIVNPPLNAIAVAHIPPNRHALAASRSAQEAVWSIMWSIKAEHIEQMDYKDCLDTSMPGLHANSALYIVLKPGVAFEPGLGSFVVDTKRAAAEGGIADTVEVGSTGGLGQLPAYRRRLLGVYDAESGSPVADAQVTILGTASGVMTSSNGLTSLRFLPDGTSTLLIHRNGFADLSLDVTIAPNDTNPVTIVLTRRK